MPSYPLLDFASRRTSITWPDGFYVGHDYDLADYMTFVRENGGASGIGVLAQITGAWPRAGRRPDPGNDLGRRVSSNDAFAFTGHANINRSYTVDGLDRVTSAGGTALSYNPLSDLTNGPGSGPGQA